MIAILIEHSPDRDAKSKRMSIANLRFTFSPQATSSATRYMASILNMLEDLGTTVSLYTTYEELFFNQPRFQHAMFNVYLDIIAMLSKAGKAFKKRRASNKHIALPHKSLYANA
jgi:hypothetical protein